VVGAVVIGQAANITAPAGGSAAVVIGQGAALTLGSNVVVIGAGASYANNNNGVVVGAASASSGGAGIANVVIVGPSITNNQTRNILIGSSMTIVAGSDNFIAGQSGTWGLSNSVVFANSAGYTTFCVGKGDSVAAPQALLFRLSNSTLIADNPGGSLTLQSGLGTGAGAASGVSLSVPIVTGTSSVLQVARVGFQVLHSAVAADTYGLIFDVNGAALKRISVGANDSGGAGFKLLRIAN
jgi:hypothetical protein